MTDPPTGWGDQILAGFVGLITIIIGWLHLRLNTVERTGMAAVASSDSKTIAGDEKIWAALDAHRKDQASFREKVLEQMTTKTDLNQMEQRLMGVLGNRKSDQI